MARRGIAEPLFEHFNRSVGQCNAEYNSSARTGVQQEHSPGVVFIHQCACMERFSLTQVGSLIGKGGGALCCVVFRETYGSVFGVVVWKVLTRADLDADVKALRRRAHAFMVKGCKRFSFVVRYMLRSKCGLKSVILNDGL